MSEEPASGRPVATPDGPIETAGVASPAGRLRRSVTSAVGVVAACYLSALLVLNLSTSTASGVISRIFPHFGTPTTLDHSSLDAAWQAIRQNYVIRDVNAGGVTQGATQGIVQFLHDTYNDRFSAYLTASQYGQLTSSLGGRRDGSIGVAVEARCPGTPTCPAGQAPTQAVFEQVLVNQPADQAGVRRGDVLVAVDGTRLESLGRDENARIDKAASLVRGRVGVSVRLTVMRGSSTVTLSVTRANLQIPSVYAQLFGHVLYVQVTGFDSDTGDLARKQLQRGLAAGATSVILDLRRNGGGYVSAAQSLVSEFVQPTPVQQDVVVRRGRLAASIDPTTAQEVVHDTIQTGGVALTQPMAVLVNGDSASASEIAAAALRDYHRATIIGERTFGKGSVQVDYPLPDGADLHLTVERWYGPRGESIEGSGITPDRPVQLAGPDSRFELAAQSAAASGDAQLQAALAVLAG